MSSQILFRSLKSGHDRIWNSHTYVRQRGSSWSHLRPYVDTDDIRDIAWNTIKPEGLSVRERENTGDCEIITYWGSTPYDEFTLEHPNESRKKAIERAKYAIRCSAQFWQYAYQEYNTDTSIEKVVQMKPKNALIFLCNITITDTIRKLAYHNDLIYLDIYHPYERHPSIPLLFEWKIVNMKTYLKAYADFQDSQTRKIKNIRGSYISISTEDPITDILNIFFKKRYKNG